MIRKFLFMLLCMTALLMSAEFFFTENSHLLTRNVVMTGTTVLAAITLLTFVISHNASLKSNPNQFVRGIMGSTFLKFALCAMAAGIYIYAERKNIHKPDLYFLMLLYVVYTAMETFFLFSVSKKSMNNQ